MKGLTIVFLFLAAQFACVSGVNADPRMETNRDFCHFILDPVNTDNEIFFADCGSVITVTEKPETALVAETVPGGESGCLDNYSALGYAQGEKFVPRIAAPLASGTRLVLTSRDSEYACYMVESNGRQYKSYKWISTISVGEPDEKGFVRVSYSLFCK